MKSNEQLNSSKKTKSQTHKIITNNSVSLSGELSADGSKRSDEVVYKRELAWQVASSLLISFKYAWAGLRYAFLTQRNFRIHVLIGVMAIALAIVLHLSPAEISLIGITIALVMAMELLNTAIESVVDLTVKQTYHELAKIAKDCAAGAVLISALASILVAGSLLLPPLLALLVRVFIGH